YHDHIGRLYFLVNPSGVKQDANGLGGGGDPSWDPVWEVQTHIDSLGWTAELRIPFSQLRYPSTSNEQTWGLQIWRQENRLNELSQWSWWGLDESGGPARFGHLTGLVIHKAPGRAEVMPYVLGQTTNAPGNTADPFYDPHAVGRAPRGAGGGHEARTRPRAVGGRDERHIYGRAAHELLLGARRQGFAR